MNQLVEQTKQSTDLILQGASAIDSRDIVLPVVGIRQNTYRKEELKKFKGGDIILRPDNVKVGDEQKGAYFVPVSIEKAYRICDVTKGEARTVGYESAHAELPLQFVRDGKSFRRDRCFISHVLFVESLASQAKMLERAKKGEEVDPSDFVLPARVIFTRAGIQAGRVLNTHFEMSKMLGRPASAMTFVLKSVERKNDLGVWFAFDVVKAEDKLKFTPKEYSSVCEFWSKNMAKSQFKAHEPDDDVVEAQMAQPIDEASATF